MVGLVRKSRGRYMEHDMNSRFAKGFAGFVFTCQCQDFGNLNLQD